MSELHVVVAGWTFGTGPSGATRRQADLLRALPPHLRRGERVTVPVEDPVLGPPRPYPDVPFPILPFRAPHLPTWRRVLAERRRLAKTLRERRADVLDLGTLPVHAHLPCPVVLTIHDLREDHPDFARRAGWFQRRVLARALGRARRVVVPETRTSTAKLGSLLGFFRAADGSPVVLNLIDTPGYLDFVGDVHCALRVVDAAILLIRANAGNASSNTRAA